LPRLLPISAFLPLPALAAETAAPGISSGTYVQATLALIFIVGLLFLATWAARKVSGGKRFGQGNMRVISGIALGPKERIVLVEVEEQWLVIGIVLLIFGVPFAVLFGVLNFLLNYIPTIGSIIGTTLPVLIAALQFDSLWPAFWLLIILMGLQMLMGNWLEPKLMGTSLGMSPLLVLFALFFWGWLWGIPGMILAVPIMAILQIIFKNIPSLNFLAALMEK